jgi:hypothetical protein
MIPDDRSLRRDDAVEENVMGFHRKGDVRELLVQA